MPVVYYSDKSDRQLKIEQERQAGRRLLSDDFVDVNGDPTDGTSGRLTTEVETPDSEVPKTITQAQFRVAVHRQPHAGHCGTIEPQLRTCVWGGRVADRFPAL